MLYKEWLFTVRNRRALLFSLTVPATLMAAQTFGPTPQGQNASTLAFYSLWTALTLGTVLRSVQRVNVERNTGLGLVYLRTGAPLYEIVAAKLAMESLTTIALLVIPVALLYFGEISGPGPVALGYIALSGLAMILLAIVLSCVARTREEYIFLAFLLLVPPIFFQPAFQSSETLSLVVGILYPPANIFSRLSFIVTGNTPGSLAIALLVAQTLVLGLIATKAYERMVTRPVR